MSIYAVTYHYGAGTDAERTTHRPQHKDFLAALHDAGTLRASGPLERGSGALLILEAGSAAEAESTLDQDPFRRHDLIAERTVREWTIVFGALQ